MFQCAEEQTFGGLQIILVGDFLQLRPVKNVLYNDPGEPCYNSAAWKAVDPHVVILEEVLRQDEAPLIKVHVPTNTIKPNMIIQFI